jgi:hypothetical protein
MPGEVKYDRSHPAGGTPEARIASRLANSGSGKGANPITPDVIVQKGNSPQRTFTNLHVNSHNKTSPGKEK